MGDEVKCADTGERRGTRSNVQMQERDGGRGQMCGCRRETGDKVKCADAGSSIVRIGLERA